MYKNNDINISSKPYITTYSINHTEQQYWNTFYKNNSIPLEPSAFALFIHEYFKYKKMNILDCGCGNGRDTYFFSKYYNVLGIDNSNKPKEYNCKFIVDDFCTFDKSGYDIIYSRFSFHSISNEQQEQFLKSIHKDSYLCIETRIDKFNNIKKEYGDTHYRNYTNVDYLKKILDKYQFEIQFIDENNGFSKYKNEDPICIRLISKKYYK